MPTFFYLFGSDILTILVNSLIQFFFLKTLNAIFLTLLMLFTMAVNGFSQNLVPNPSFEDTTNCSIDNQIFRTPPWQEPTAGTSDWLNPCASSPSGSTVPNNDFGVQNAQNGSSYAGFILFTDGFNYREYIQVQLLDSLVPTTKYWVSFYVSLADSSEYAVKEIGAYFSDTAVYSSDIIPLLFSPQIKSTTFLIDKSSWILISGTFIANGAEKFITLGTFQDSASINILNVGGAGGEGFGTSYYYIDNICISNDSTTCDIPTNIIINNLDDNISFYPNPFSANATLIVNYNIINSNNDVYYSIYDIMGNLVKKELITDIKTHINRDFLSTGIYFLRIAISTKQQYIKKIIIIN